MVFVGNILMNRIVRKAGERKVAAREKNFNLISRREFLDAIEDVGGSFPGQHSVWLQFFSL